MRQDKNQFAKEIFKLNMMLYSESYNVYDSYAEVCMLLGEDELAIEYYQKSLDLNPENRHANHQIEKIKEGQ